MNELFQVFLLSMLPIVEQKGAIALGIITFQIDPIRVMIINLIGSLLPAPFILLFFNKVFSFMKRYKLFNAINRIIDKKIAKNSERIERNKEIALIVFIGIPLPTTGIWTGSAIASFLNLDFKKSMLCVVIGATISALLITMMSVLFPSLLFK